MMARRKKPERNNEEVDLTGTSEGEDEEETDDDEAGECGDDAGEFGSAEEEEQLHNQ